MTKWARVHCYNLTTKFNFICDYKFTLIKHNIDNLEFLVLEVCKSKFVRVV
jgi:hypothetical protein